MGRLRRKRSLQAVGFYFCAAIFLALIWAYKTTIWMATISILNSMIELLDTLAGG